MTEKLQRLIETELECIIRDTRKILMATIDERTIDYEISLIESHLSVIRGELEYENIPKSKSSD